MASAEPNRHDVVNLKRCFGSVAAGTSVIVLLAHILADLVPVFGIVFSGHTVVWLKDPQRNAA